MRVLLVSKFLERRGGVETYLYDLGRILSERGVDVQFFGVNTKNRELGNECGVYAPPIELGGSQGLAKVKDIGRTINSPDSARALSKLLDKLEPDVIHFNNIHYHLTPSTIEAAHEYKMRSRKPVGIVMTMHDYHSLLPCDGCMNNASFEVCDQCIDRKFARCALRGCTRGGRAKSIVAAAEAMYWNHRHVYRLLDRVICPSDCMRQKFDQVDDFAGRTVHLANFCNVERSCGIKSNYVLYFGAYHRDKGLATLLDIAERHPEIQFKCAGRGPLAERMRGIPNVEDLGFNSGKALRRIVGAARLCVVPSEVVENSPFVALEALCSSTPVLGARIGGIPELVNDGATGELFEFRNAEDFERRLVSLMGDPDRLDRYTKNCASFEPMSQRRYYELLLDVYAEAMKKKE